MTLKTAVTNIGRGVGGHLAHLDRAVPPSARDWRDAGLVAGTTLALVPADRAVDRWVAGHPSALPIAAALYTTGFATRTRALRDAGVGLAATTSADAGAVVG